MSQIPEYGATLEIVNTFSKFNQNSMIIWDNQNQTRTWGDKIKKIYLFILFNYKYWHKHS